MWIGWLSFRITKMFVLFLVFGTVYPLLCYDCIETDSQSCKNTDYVDCKESCVTKQMNFYQKSLKAYFSYVVWPKVSVFVCIIDVSRSHRAQILWFAWWRLLFRGRLLWSVLYRPVQRQNGKNYSWKFGLLTMTQFSLAS